MLTRPGVINRLNDMQRYIECLDDVTRACYCKKRPVRTNRLSRKTTDRYCNSGGAGCLPVTLPQPVTTRAYLQAAVDQYAHSHRMDSLRQYVTAVIFMPSMKGRCLLNATDGHHRLQHNILSGRASGLFRGPLGKRNLWSLPFLQHRF